VADGPEWRNYLRFRDVLLKDPQLVREYTALKIALAAKCPDDRSSYTNAKGQFIEKVLNGAV
jgi:GrpB-like predicted nucleotidyltransferase (UPF0157 family)